MSRERSVEKTKPGFGKRGSARVKQAERKPAAVGRLAQIFGRWWGKKEPRSKVAQKGFGAKR